MSGSSRGLLAFAYAFTLGAATILATTPAHADGADVDIARAHYATGTRYYGAARYGEAVKEFLEAYRLAQRTELLYNIGLCYEKLDDPGRATGYFERYLANKPEAPERAEIHARLYELSRRVGKLAVKSTTPGTEIWIDGLDAGPAPLPPQPMTEGHHRVEARLGDRVPSRVELEVRAGLLTEVTIEPGSDVAPVVVAPPPTPLRAAAPTSEPPAATAHADLTPSPPTESAPPPPPKRRWLVGVIVGVAAVVIAGATIGVVAASSGPDVRSDERARCAAASCSLLDFGAAR